MLVLFKSDAALVGLPIPCSIVFAPKALKMHEGEHELDTGDNGSSIVWGIWI